MKRPLDISRIQNLISESIYAYFFILFLFFIGFPTKFTSNFRSIVLRWSREIWFLGRMRTDDTSMSRCDHRQISHSILSFSLFLSCVLSSRPIIFRRQLPLREDKLKPLYH